MPEPAFDDSHVLAAIDYLRDVVAGEIEPTRTYTQVFDTAGVKTPRDMYLGGESEMITRFMKAIHDRCRQDGLPPYDSLVVNASLPRKDKPGSGYFVVNGYADPFSGRAPEHLAGLAANFWKDQQDQCWNPRR